jgi:hypothetical protein
MFFKFLEDRNIAPETLECQTIDDLLLLLLGQSIETTQTESIS